MRPDSPDSSPAARDAVLDRRVRPQGALPRHLQTWLMVGLAVIMLAIILVTGHPTAPKRADAPVGQPSNALNPERLRNYQEQLAQQEIRLRQELAETQAAAATSGSAPAQSKETQPVDPMVEEQRRRAYSSLFADNLAYTRRNGATPKQDPGDAGTIVPLPAAPPITSTANTPALPTAGTNSPAPAVNLSSIPTAPVAPGHKRLSEGTVIEAVLTNRLEGSFVGQVNALITTAVYSLDRQAVLIPAGARALGTAAPVQALGQARLAVKFHRLIMPNGQSFTLDQFGGLNQRGDAGLNDQVNRHYLQLFGASMAIGALSGLAQFSTRSTGSDGYSFGDAYGQGLGGSLAASSGRILDRFLNVLPSVTIREGHRLKIYLTSDLDLPPYDGSKP
jgi:type IV secretory pathway VirB10-like protein